MTACQNKGWINQEYSVNSLGISYLISIPCPLFSHPDLGSRSTSDFQPYFPFSSAFTSAFEPDNHGLIQTGDTNLVDFLANQWHQSIIYYLPGRKDNQQGTPDLHAGFWLPLPCTVHILYGPWSITQSIYCSYSIKHPQRTLCFSHNLITFPSTCLPKSSHETQAKLKINKVVLRAHHHQPLLCLPCQIPAYSILNSLPYFIITCHCQTFFSCSRVGENCYRLLMKCRHCLVLHSME